MAYNKILFKLETAGETLRCVIEGYGLMVVPKTEVIKMEDSLYWLHEIDEAA
jgi:hypothetical protein